MDGSWTESQGWWKNFSQLGIISVRNDQNDFHDGFMSLALCILVCPCLRVSQISDASTNAREEFAACWHFLATGQKLRRKGQQNKPNVTQPQDRRTAGHGCRVYVIYGTATSSSKWVEVHEDSELGWNGKNLGFVYGIWILLFRSGCYSYRDRNYQSGTGHWGEI